jgi:hypothetical protein
MPDLVLAKATDNTLVPLDDQSVAYIARFARGAGFTASVRQHNNPAFHRKLMALFQHAFEAWEPADLYYQGEPVRKEFTQFRKDLTILAGYYDPCVTVRGKVLPVARSLNFSTMEHAEREALFSAVIDVVLGRILTNYTRADLDNVLAQTLGFAR